MSDKERDLESILYFMNSALRIPEFPDYERALNGLQVEGTGPVRKIGVAVDASVQTIGAAVAGGVDLLIVHHGIYWDGLQPMAGRRYRRVAPLIRAGTALYSAHLPLDAHPEMGNCVQLLHALGLNPEERFGCFKDVDIGFTARVNEGREEFSRRVEEVVGGAVRLIEGGPVEVRKIGVVTGGGGSFVKAAAEAGLDTLVTGEGTHHTYLDALEFGVNVVLAGHYATETFGVRALAASVEKRFGIPWEFLDFPSGF
jgi:dinuclear metal center YbgI/SA1388 family protein